MAKLVWNSTAQDWVNSPNAINEVGCIHTVQGYDLNYVGVIIGPEFSYNKKENQFFVNRDKYYDINGKGGVTDQKELKRYIINIYKTLMTRGIKGTYLYIVNEDLREFTVSVSYSEAMLMPGISYRNMFREIKLETGNNIFVERQLRMPMVEIPFSKELSIEDRLIRWELAAPFEKMAMGLSEYY